MQTRAPTNANALARETSLYLRQHAANPVEWLPWGDEAFARARSLDRPIFLSIGYSTCHWCHVMARESFEEPAVAALLNTHFVPVKVDREERPDVDRLHMAFVQATTGHGGWPLSVWLTPQLEPFFGGTYFPPDDRWGRPGFSSVLRGIAQTWTERRAEVAAAAARAVEFLRSRAVDRELAGSEATAVSSCIAYLKEQFDAVHGGFGGAPKFPRPVNLNLLFRALARETDAEAADLAERVDRTLAGMAYGGVRDQIGGGFHRYSVDAGWRVPHFEKMLYDQAQLVVNYLEGWQATGRLAWAEVARDTLAYVERDLAAPEGGYFAAEDADSVCPERPGEHGEGVFYVWRHVEFAEVCGELAAGAAEHFGVLPEGNAPPEGDPQGEFRGANILWRPQPDHDDPGVWAEARARLFAARQCRPRPSRDEKIVTAWNGLMVSALARASQVLGEQGWLESGIRAARFLWTRVRDQESGELRRSWCGGRAGGAGFAEDYACLIAAFIDLYEAGASIRWLHRAVELQEQMDARFGDPTDGAYFGSAAGDASTIVRLKDEYDGAEPSANSVAALNLLRLGISIGRTDWRKRGEAVVEALRPHWQAAPWTVPQLLVAIDFARGPVRSVVLVGRRSAPEMQHLASALHRRLEAPRVILWIDGAAERSWFAERLEWVSALSIEAERPTAYLCRDGVCLAPITDPAALARAMET